MDDRGRLAQSLRRIARHFSPRSERAAAVAERSEQPSRARRLSRAARFGAAAIIITASIAYAMLVHEQVPGIAGLFKDAREWAARASGLRVGTIVLTGNHHVSREEVLASAGITGATSLVFLDVEDAREQLKRNPWIADATLLKLYPRELQITIKEREPFALWQKHGHVTVIADDGIVLEPYVAPQLLHLPLVVGDGAGAKAKELLGFIDRHPSLRDFVYASILVAERRWNLRLKNGIEVLLPETAAGAAIEKLVALDAVKNLITRDVVLIDLRLPDRVTVRLSDGAAQARMDALRDKMKKKAGNA
jgi:cell division protein FtsQ